ncbi:MAG: patatin-like phospholipase family protein, partial [Isosphaeraceae bacterium]
GGGGSGAQVGVREQPPWIGLIVSVCLAVILVVAYWRLLPLLGHLAGTQALLIATIVLPFLLIFGVIGRSYGINLLFWHERYWRRAVSAFGLTLLIVNFVAVAYYISVRPADGIANDYFGQGLQATSESCARLIPSRLKGVNLAKESSERFSLFLWMAVPPLLLIMTLPAFFPRLARIPTKAFSLTRRVRYLAAWIGGIAVGLVAVWAIIWVGGRLYPWLKSRPMAAGSEFVQLENQKVVVAELLERLGTRPETTEDWIDLSAQVKTASERFAGIVNQGQNKKQLGHFIAVQRARSAWPEIIRAINAIEQTWRSRELFGPTDPPAGDHDQPHWDEAAGREYQRIGEQIGLIGLALDELLMNQTIKLATLTLFLLQLGVFAAFALITPLFRRITSALAICLLLSALVTLYTAYLSLFPRDGVDTVLLVVGVVVVIGALNSRPYKLTFPGLENYYDGPPVSLDDALTNAPFEAAPGTISDDRALEAWSKNHPDRQWGEKPKLVLVAASGGAARSALWVALVLDALGQKIPGFASHVRIISGASGGMVGAAYYVAALRTYRDEGKANSDPTLKDFPTGDVVGSINRDGLNDVAKQLLLRDVPSILQFWRQSNDRGRVLERTWDSGGLVVPFVEFAEAELSGWIPSLILSPMMVEDGRRLLISNLELPYMTAARDHSQIDQETLDRYGCRLSTSAVEFRQLFKDPERPPKLPLSTAVRMSASFPYVSPAVNLPTLPLRSVVDAGYYDNYGVSVAASWLSRHIDDLRDLTSGVVLVQIRDQVSQDSRLGTGMVQDPGIFRFVSDAFRFVTSPLQGAGSARYASTSFRNDEFLMSLSERMNHDGGDFFTTVAFENGADVSLNWYVSDAQLDSLKAQLDPNSAEGRETKINLDRIAKLHDWWGRDHSLNNKI